MLSYCLDCAANDISCCEGTQIYVTLGDIQRIRDYGIHGEFFIREPLGETYLTGGDDPEWNPLILEPDGRRRILALKEDGNCLFLTEKGCKLPGDVRPLLCRIYPFDFKGPKITGICKGCQISKCENWQEILEQSQMNLSTATGWVEKLYQEISQERAATVKELHCPSCPSNSKAICDR